MANQKSHLVLFWYTLNMLFRDYIIIELDMVSENKLTKKVAVYTSLLG